MKESGFKNYTRVALLLKKWSWPLVIKQKNLTLKIVPVGLVVLLLGIAIMAIASFW